MRIRPTELGWKGLVLLVVLAVVFLATAYANLFFLLLVFCGALGACGAAWTWGNLRGVTVELSPVRGAPAVASRPVELVLRAAGRPRVAVAVELVTDAGAVAVADVDSVRAHTVVEASLPARSRGVVAVRAVRVSSTFPLGLFLVTRRVAVAAELVTWPAPLSAAGAARVPDDGERAAPLLARGSSLAGLRPFRTGDALADVHWKATARRGTAVVKERERDAEPAAVIVLDRRCAAAPFEAALGRIAHAVLQLDRTGGSLRVVAQEADFTVGADGRSLAELQRWLAATTTLPAAAPAPADVPHATRLPTLALELVPTPGAAP